MGPLNRNIDELGTVATIDIDGRIQAKQHTYVDDLASTKHAVPLVNKTWRLKDLGDLIILQSDVVINMCYAFVDYLYPRA